MFVMTADIRIAGFKPLKGNSLRWRRDVRQFSDTASIRMPGLAMMKRDGDTYSQVDTGLQLKEGMKVEIWAGYNGQNELRFKGFIRRRNFTLPLELECEGYSYQLRKKQGYSAYYAATTVRQILQDVTAGTDIKLSDRIPDIPLKNIYFKNVSGVQVLEYLKEKCLLTVFFDFDVLYCGLEMTDYKKVIPYRLGWNVVKDNDLKFEADRELAQVNIQVEKRDKDGSKKKGKTDLKDGSTKVLKLRHIYDEASLKKIAEEKRQELLYKGYTGAITTFLTPYAEPSMAAKISDSRYPEREGLYFIDSVEGTFDQNGGRQKIGIGRLIAT